MLLFSHVVRHRVAVVVKLLNYHGKTRDSSEYHVVVEFTKPRNEANLSSDANTAKQTHHVPRQGQHIQIPLPYPQMICCPQAATRCLAPRALHSM
jgi:hypothetical protein